MRRGGDLLLQPRLHRRLDFLDDGEEELLFGREEEVEGALGDAGRAGELLDGGRADAAPGEEVFAGGEEPLADGGAFGIGECAWHVGEYMTV